MSWWGIPPEAFEFANMTGLAAPPLEPAIRSYYFPQSVADEHTLIAQRYAGYLVGHPYHHAQQTMAGPDTVKVETADWREPIVLADDCEFCLLLTDERAVERVAGYQNAIDVETIRSHSGEYNTWLQPPTEAPETEDVLGVFAVDSDEVSRRGIHDSQANRRRFLETHRYGDAARPGSGDVDALPMVDLPLRLKRKMCIEWNHVYRDLMATVPGLVYDATKQEFLLVNAPAEESTGAAYG